jgi:hypothetical protein
MGFINSVSLASTHSQRSRPERQERMVVGRPEESRLKGGRCRCWRGVEEHGELVAGWDGKLEEEIEVGKIFFEVG